MIELHGWSVRDYLTFGDTSVELAHDHGLYVVHGENKDSRTADNTNAVGKSRLLSIIPTILYESDPLALTKSNKKDVLRAKTSSAELVIQSHEGHAVAIRQTASKYFICEQEDGEYKDQKAIKLDVARNLIKKAFPLSRNTFYATCYIQAQRDCGFQRADPRARLNYITDLFSLNIYDDLHKEFKKKLSTLAKTEIESEIVAQNLKTAQADLVELEKKLDPSIDLDKIQRQSKKVTDKLRKLYSKQGALSQSKTVAEKHTRLTKRVRSTLKRLAKAGIDSDTDLKATLKAIQKEVRSSESYLDYKEALVEYRAQLADLNTELESLGKSKRTLDELEEAYTKISKQLSKLERKQSDYEDSVEDFEKEREAYRSLSRQIEESIKTCRKTYIYKTFLSKHVEPENWLEIVRPIAVLSSTTAMLWSKLHNHKDISECPVCGNNDVDYDALQKRAKEADRIAEEYDYFAELDVSLGELGKRPKKPKESQNFDREISDLRAKLKKVKVEGKNLEDRKHIEKAITRLTKPKKVAKPTRSLEDNESLIELIEGLISDRTRIKDMEPSLGLVVDGDLDTVVKEIRKLTKKLESYDSVIKKHGILKLSIDQATSIITKSTKQLEAIGPLIQQRKILKGLVAAYTPKHLKLQAAVNILTMLEDSLNKYSNLVYLEPMRFEIRAMETGVSAVAIRNNGERSDICHLSGAESNCFRLLFAISLLPLLPERMRTNFLILDEPDGACSEPVREHLIREFLPKLRAIVPHVFWITPKAIDSFENCTVLKVIKEDGISRLESS